MHGQGVEDRATTHVPLGMNMARLTGLATVLHHLQCVAQRPLNIRAVDKARHWIEEKGCAMCGAG